MNERRAVRALLLNERDELLLIRLYVPDTGRHVWLRPGGGMEAGETTGQALVREVWEESGFHVVPRKVIGVYDANRSGALELFHAFKVIFLCELMNGEGESFTPAYTSFETSEVKFFTYEEIPTDLSSQRTNPRHILDAYRAYQQPDTPTVFD